MGKIVKYCAICEESFSEKFSFCPNCSAQLTTYEMNPVVKEAKLETSISSSEETYNITFVENRSGKTRQTLLLGAFFLVTGGFSLALVMSIYNTDAYVAALDDNLIKVVYVSPDDELKIEQEQKDKNKNEENTGGGGGDEDTKPVSKGRFADQVKDPQLPPSVKIPQLKNPELVIKPATLGEKQQKPSNEPYGIPYSQYDVASDGIGSDGGQGTGRNRGQGDGDGPGIIRGRKGGCCGGDTGEPARGGQPDPGNEEEKTPPPLKVVTVGMKILSKPRAIYTDAARRNQIAGTVTLRVTFLASGQIGNIVAIGGLPDGLTEQAIIAARNIQFEPAKRNGVPQTVTKQVQYTFTLY